MNKEEAKMQIHDSMIACVFAIRLSRHPLLLNTDFFTKFCISKKTNVLKSGERGLYIQIKNSDFFLPGPAFDLKLTFESIGPRPGFLQVHPSDRFMQAGISAAFTAHMIFKSLIRII